MKKFILGMLFFLSTLLTAGDNPRAMIVFDASGSMWGQIEGKSKIEIAKDTFKNVVNKWNPAVELGLTVYGHRTKGDCNDIETVIPVGKIDKNRVISTVMKIQPKGKTPISRSLRKAAEEIRYTEEKAILVNKNSKVMIQSIIENGMMIQKEVCLKRWINLKLHSPV